MVDKLMWRSVGSVVTWPANWTAGVEQEDGTIKQVLLREKAGHMFTANHVDDVCPYCLEAGGSHTKYREED